MMEDTLKLHLRLLLLELEFSESDFGRAWRCLLLCEYLDLNLQHFQNIVCLGSRTSSNVNHNGELQRQRA